MITINKWSYNHGESINHSGVRGMRWGQRKSLRQKVDKEQRSSIKKRESDYVKNDPKVNKHLGEARRLANKYDFDQDDGGGGSTKKSQDAGRRYMEHLEKSEFMMESIHRKAVKDTNIEITKKYTADLLTQIGRKNMIEFE